MKSTDGIELSNFVDPNLTWKKVGKGRSTMRRSRKSVAKSQLTEVVVAADKNATKMMAEGVSESEKLGVAVLSQHFAGKPDHLPIKKRRSIFGSSSPSTSRKSSSPCRKVTEHVVQINHVPHLSKLSTGGVDGRPVDVPRDNHSCNGHDFYGIEILADVACNSNVGDEFVPALQQLNPVNLSVPVEGSSSSSKATNDLQNDVLHEDATGVTTSQNHLVALSDKFSPDGCIEVVVPGQAENTAAQNKAVAVLDIPLADESNGIFVEVETVKIASENRGITGLGKCSADESVIKSGHVEVKSAVCENNSASVSDKSSADECNVKPENAACPRDDRLLWDLNLSVDAWEQHCGLEDDDSQRNCAGNVSVDVHTQRDCPSSSNYNADGVTESGGNGNLMRSDINCNSSRQCESQSGYDSQIEDGELRESYPWEENVGDAGEIEHVDYNSEPEEERFDSLSVTNEKEMDDIDKGDLLEVSSAPRQSDSRLSGDSLRSRTDANDGSHVEKRVAVCVNGSNFKGSSKEFVPKAFKRDFPSCDATHTRRFSNYGDSCDRDVGSDKSIGRDRSFFHPRGRSRGRGHYGYYDSSRRHHSPIYNNGPREFGRPKPRTIAEGGRGFMNSLDHPASGIDGHVRNRFPNGAYRNGFRRYPEGLNREFGGNEPGGRTQHRMANRRDRSNSPVVFRRLHYPQTYRKSQSRSRSRSPVPWNNRNRSPNFRIDRPRIPFQRRFPVDHEAGFVLPSWNRGSPQRYPRWFEDRNNTGGDDNNKTSSSNNFRRKSPGRTVFRPRQRFDSGQTRMRRVSTEDEFVRPMVRDRRFQDDERRDCKYDGKEEEEGRKGRKYEMFNNVRRYDNYGDGDSPRRFRFSGEESHVAND